MRNDFFIADTFCLNAVLRRHYVHFIMYMRLVLRIIKLFINDYEHSDHK